MSIFSITPTLSQREVELYLGLYQKYQKLVFLSCLQKRLKGVPVVQASIKNKELWIPAFARMTSKMTFDTAPLRVWENHIQN